MASLPVDTAMGDMINYVYINEIMYMYLYICMLFHAVDINGEYYVNFGVYIYIHIRYDYM